MFQLSGFYCMRTEALEIKVVVPALGSMHDRGILLWPGEYHYVFLGDDMDVDIVVLKNTHHGFYAHLSGTRVPKDEVCMVFRVCES